MTERRTSAEMARRLEQAGFELEVAPTGKRWWREPGTGRMLSGDHAAELLRREEERALEQAGWERTDIDRRRDVLAQVRFGPSLPAKGRPRCDEEYDGR